MFCGCGAPIDVSGPDTVDGRRPVMTAAIPPAADCPPPAVRMWYVNNTPGEEGSCVQDANGLVGVVNNNLRMATLPFDTVYGPAIRGGSNPTRVADYFRQRQIRAYSITGSTRPWIEYAADTGRQAALGFDAEHFQTMTGRDKELGVWYVCDNRWPQKIRTYSDRDFWRMHDAMGYRWCIVLDCPAPPPVPQIIVR